MSLRSFVAPFIVALAATTAVASPIAAPQVTPAAVLEKRSTCTFSGSSGAASASKSKADCATIVLSAVAVPSGVTLDLTDLTEGTHVIFEGETTFGYEEWDGPLISVSGTDITVTGASGHEINVDGSRWWDGEGTDGGKTKPAFFYAHNLISSTIESLNVLNTAVQAFSVDDCTDLNLIDITINDSDGDTDDLGHNTDGLDIGDSTGVYISGATVYNQDDCLAINSGTDITFTGGYCSGGHGLSIGSVGGRDDNTVSDILIESSTVIDSENGVRIKTVYDATGEVTGVTYKDITLSGITDYGIVIEQDYENGSPTGTPTAGVPITDLTLDGITGTVSGGYNVYILCAEDACSDWTWTDVDVTGGDTDSKCENVPSGASCSD